MPDVNIDNNTNKNLDIGVKKENTNKIVFLIFSIIFSIFGFLMSCVTAFIKYKLKMNFDTSYTTGYLTGTITVSIVIIAAIFLLAIGVFKKYSLLLLFSVLFLLVSFSSTSKAFNGYLKEIAMDKAAEDKLVSMCTNIVNGTEMSKENFDKSEYGNMAPLLSLINDYSIKSNNTAKEMSTSIDSLGFSTMLSADTLGSAQKINDAKAKLNDSIKVYDKYESEYNNLMTEFDTKISTIDLPKSYKGSFLEGFKESQDENHERMTSFLKVERDASYKMIEMMDFMLSIQGKYTVRDGKILFYTNDDLNKFNGYLADVKKFAQDEDNIKKDMQDSLKRKLDELNKQK